MHGIRTRIDVIVAKSNLAAENTWHTEVFVYYYCFEYMEDIINDWISLSLYQISVKYNGQSRISRQECRCYLKQVTGGWAAGNDPFYRPESPNKYCACMRATTDPLNTRIRQFIVFV